MANVQTYKSVGGFELQIAEDTKIVDELALNYCQQVRNLPVAFNSGSGFPAPPEGYDAVRTLRTGESFYTDEIARQYLEQLEELLTVA